MLQFMVEILMKKLEAQMFKAMHHYMGLSVDDYSQSFEGNLEGNIKIYNERILNLVDLVREKQTRVMSITLANLITLDVHNEKAMKNLLVKGVKRINEFDWIMNIPYYLDQSLKPDEYNCVVKSVQTDFSYDYEYVGNAEILVITPLKVKCNLTLKGAVIEHMGVFNNYISEENRNMNFKFKNDFSLYCI